MTVKFKGQPLTKLEQAIAEAETVEIEVGVAERLSVLECKFEGLQRAVDILIEKLAQRVATI